MIKFYRGVLLLFSLSLLACASKLSVAEPANPLASQETVILLHGLGRSDMAMWLLEHRLENAGYKVFSIDYDSIQQTPNQVLGSVFSDIEKCCKEAEATIHFVGHSLGGLIIRAYLGQHDVKNLGKVVLIGSPSNGTPVVDKYRDSWWMQFAGEMTLALGTDDNGFAKSLPKPDYSLGVIAGTVERSSNDEIIPGADDGLVPVESTKIEGMSDFILLPISHSAMRYDADVAAQTITYLRNGSFMH
ncbi:MAG: hypothetical protein MI867_18535 [Pseudomonadales bacterium]|nr:hypothetical protein [Pseudomonadales bacterium]